MFTIEWIMALVWCGDVWPFRIHDSFICIYQYIYTHTHSHIYIYICIYIIYTYIFRYTDMFFGKSCVLIHVLNGWFSGDSVAVLVEYDLSNTWGICIIYCFTYARYYTCTYCTTVSFVFKPYTYIYMYIYVHIYKLYIYILVCIYIYIHV